MQATAIVQDVLLKPDSHAIMSRQVYNKSKAYLNWATERMGIQNTIVEELTAQTLRDSIRPNTTFVFAETFTNPLMDALDLNALSDAVVELRESSRGLRFVVDNTIVTPWGVQKPLLDYPGIDAVVSAGTKAMGGQDRDMWGYIASNRIDFLNMAMDIQAMRGGVLSWRSATSVKESLVTSESRFSKRCENANSVVKFLEDHPLIEEVFHPSASTYRHAPIFKEQYKLGGSLLSFRINNLDEDETGHFCDVLAMTIPFRYALSFDGLVSKVNHHKSVSEYYTPPPLLKKQGINRLVRLGVGCEEADDLIACLNWALWNHHKLSPDQVRQSQRDRILSLGLEIPAALLDDE
jgi:cystathionine beta-lyase/cystathionine gamma-synthase